MDAERPNPPSPRAESARLPHQPLLDAHDAYFSDLQAIWFDTQQRAQDIQLQFQSALQQAFQSQAQTDFQAAQGNYQSSIQALYADAAQTERYAEAYQKYKRALQDAVAGMNVDDLDPQALAAVGQSLLAVAQYASQLSLRPPFGAPAPDDRKAASAAEAA